MLETCHRVEAYLGNADDAARLAPALPAGGRALTGEQAVHHAMTVAVGRDSVVVGEDQILHQLRASVDAARATGTLDPALERLFALALQAGRRARSWRQGPARSLADVALASIERQVGALRGRDVLVVGAGSMGRLAAGLRSPRALPSLSRTDRPTEPRRWPLRPAPGSRRSIPRPGSAASRASSWRSPDPGRSGPRRSTRLLVSATVVVDLSVPAAVPDRLAESPWRAPHHGRRSRPCRHRPLGAGRFGSSARRARRPLDRRNSSPGCRDATGGRPPRPW